MTTDETLRINVVYALPEKQALVCLNMPVGSTVEAALEASGLLQAYPEIDLDRNRLGVFAKPVRPETVLRDRDRVEIYRPLIADPKEVRKRRAAEGKAMKAGGSAGNT